MSKIAENTWISLSLALGLIGGGAAWMTRQELISSANADAIEKVEAFTQSISRILINIDKRLYSIEEMLKQNNRRK